MSSENGSDGLEEQRQDWDDWSDDESSGWKSLFEPGCAFSSLDEVLEFDSKQHDFNLRQFRSQHFLDHYDTLRCINYIRGEVAAGRDPRAMLQQGAPSNGAWPWADDRFLQPVLPDDELLFHDWEDEDHAAGTDAAGSTVPTGGWQLEATRLQEENAALRGTLEAMQALVLQDDVVRELLTDVDMAAAGVQLASTSQASNTQQPQGQQQAQQVPAGVSEAARRIDADYFGSYSTFDIHRDMLADRARTEAYRDALERNPVLLRGASVLDVGCGTGILSMFAARGGAAAVVGVDGSEFIASHARANVEANCLGRAQGGPVTIVASRVEALEALPLPLGSEQQGKEQQQVDVLVSEWMGYALFFESMLDSVLYARDRFLRPGSAILPDIARIYLAPAGAGATRIPFWRSVYGFDMPSVANSLRQSALHEVLVHTVPGSDMLGEGVEVRAFDLATMNAGDQDFTADFRLTVSQGPVECHALVLWFDTLFSERFCKEHPVELSTSPFTTPTHWGQAVLTLAEPVRMAPSSAAVPAQDDRPAAAVALRGTFSMARSKHTHRTLDISLSYVPVAADGSSSSKVVTQIYSMGVNG